LLENHQKERIREITGVNNFLLLGKIRIINGSNEQSLA
jgi:hypothetical protein